jgi:hypothetical protein
MGTAIGCTTDFGRGDGFARWQNWQSLHHWFMSAARPGHKKRLLTMRRVALAPG